MKKLGLVVCLFVNSLMAQTVDSAHFEDDPIAAMLDSLTRFQFFSKEVYKNPVGYPKYHYNRDSVPRFDEMTIEARLAKLDANSPFLLQYNNAVKGYIDMYTMRRRSLVERMIGLSQLYFPMFEEQLDKYKLPLEFKYLAIVESALNPVARSRSGAGGLWQFMYGTGKMYGLKVNSYVDERSDPYQSTIAACQYLSFLYEMFNDWEMVLAAYNSGPGTVNKAIRRSGGKKTYWEIRPYLPLETQGYVPAFIAVNYVMNYSTEHNLYSSIPERSFFSLDTVGIKQEITFEQISAVLDIPVEEIQFLNPQYKRKVIPFNGEDKNKLCLPSTKVGAFINNEMAIYRYFKRDSSAVAMKEIQKTITVGRGEHLQMIANRYRCSVNDIREWNRLRSLAVKPGQKLTVYVLVPASTTNEVTAQAAVKAKYNSPVVANAPIASTNTSAKNSNAEKFHTIRKGDTLWIIAKQYNITVDDLKRVNGFGSRYMLLPGQKIKIGSAG